MLHDTPTVNGVRIKNNVFSLKGPGNYIYITILISGTKRTVCSSTDPLGHSHVDNASPETHHSHRTVEDKDQRRVSLTALGKEKSTGDGATSRPTPRTSGRVNQGVNVVLRSRDYLYVAVKTNKARPSRNMCSSSSSSGKTGEEQTSRPPT